MYDCAPSNTASTITTIPDDLNEQLNFTSDLTAYFPLPPVRASPATSPISQKDAPRQLLNPRYDEDLDFDPSAFLATRTLGSASQLHEDDPPSIPLLASTPTAPALAGGTGGAERSGLGHTTPRTDQPSYSTHSKMGDFAPPEHINTANTTTYHNATASPSRRAHTSASSPSQSHVVHPATVPLRTSSAVYSQTPKKRRSLNSVTGERLRRYSSKLPEVDERNWLSQGRESKDMSAGIPHAAEATESTQRAGLLDSPFKGADPMDHQHAVSWSTEKENILKGPFEYIESHPGKDIRGELIAAFNVWLQVPSASLAIISRVVGMLHTASLLVDDVEDDSKLRRGVPVAHSIFGTAQTINSANYVYFCALQELLKLDNPEVVRIYTEELLNLHRGQGMDLFWRDTLTCPTEDDYLEMVGNKTGGLFRLAIKLMCAESPSHHSPSGLIVQHPQSDPSSTSTFSSSSTARPLQTPDYIPLVNTIGLLFQILDDYLNLSSEVYTINKGLCEDLTEGKFSFPIIHAIRSEPQNLVLINILKQKTRDDDVKRYAVAFMERCGSFAYTRRVLRGLLKKAQALVEEVDGGRAKADGMRDILEKLKVERLSSAGKGPAANRESARSLT